MLDERELARHRGTSRTWLAPTSSFRVAIAERSARRRLPSDDEAIFVNVGKTIAAFVETLVSGRTAFDQFRDALARGAPPPPGAYSDAAQRGLKIFIGKGGCANCHSGPNFTGGEFFTTGLSRFAPNGKADAGRVDGARKLLASRFNLLGPYNDDASARDGEADTSTRHRQEEHR